MAFFGAGWRERVPLFGRDLMSERARAVLVFRRLRVALKMECVFRLAWKEKSGEMGRFSFFFLLKKISLLVLVE